MFRKKEPEKEPKKILDYIVLNFCDGTFLKLGYNDFNDIFFNDKYITIIINNKRILINMSYVIYIDANYREV